MLACVSTPNTLQVPVSDPSRDPEPEHVPLEMNHYFIHHMKIIRVSARSCAWKGNEKCFQVGQLSKLSDLKRICLHWWNAVIVFTELMPKKCSYCLKASFLSSLSRIRFKGLRMVSYATTEMSNA